MSKLIWNRDRCTVALLTYMAICDGKKRNKDESRAQMGTWIQHMMANKLSVNKVAKKRMVANKRWLIKFP
jgi:hypothetical protein